MKFNKITSIFLTLFLLVSNLGLAITVHYCDNQIASVTLSTASNKQNIEKDCCEKVEKESKCCKNKIIKSTQKLDQITVKIISVDANYNLVFNEWKSVVFANKNNFKTREITTYCWDANAPPLYLLYSQYTFYA